jgi:hypothetical protein
MNENEKKPNHRSKNKDEKKLGKWISTQLNNYEKGMKDATRYDMWTIFMNEFKQYFQTDDEIWNSNFDKLKQFIEVNKRRPYEKSINDQEKNLGLWLSVQKRNYKYKLQGMKDEKRYNTWLKFQEKYNKYFPTYDEIWKSNLDKLKQFIKENKRIPDSDSYLNRWLYNQNKNYENKKGIVNKKKHYNVWTEFLTEYSEYFTTITNYEIWSNNLSKLIIFIDTNGKKPSVCSIVEEEQTLANWVYQNNKNYKNIEYGMKNKLQYDMWTEFIKKYNEYFPADDEIWNNNLSKLIIFIDTNNKKPSVCSIVEEEQVLGRWLISQKRNYKNKTEGMKDENRYNTWSDFQNKYNKYLLSQNDAWDRKLVELKQYLTNCKKTPHSGSKLGRWMYNQIKNYENKKGLINKKTKYNAWTTFMNEFKQYFDNIECVTTVTTVSETVLSSSSSTPPKQKSMKLKTSSSKTKNAIKERIKSEISVLHQKYKTMKSSNLQSEFRENPEKWHHYHKISEENEKSYPEEDIPRNRIIQELSKIKTKRTKMVIDMGCGKAHISEYFASDKRFQFINYDHIACNPSVTTCDISCLPLDEDSVEICILSLAMWGSNCKEYIQEANRILESNGKLYIIEATKRWSEQDDQGNILPEKEACKLKTLLEENGFQIVEKSIEKFCLFVCIKL